MIYLVIASIICVGCPYEKVGPFATFEACEVARADRTLAPEKQWGACVPFVAVPHPNDMRERWP